jgi:CRP/FNR family transcriptional regulator
MKHANIACSACEAKNHSLFSLSSCDELDKLMADKTCNRFKRNQVIFFEGNKPLGLFCIQTGAVKIYKTGPDGKEQIIRFGQAGDFLGYRALIAEESYSASAEALQDTVVCFIPRNYFFQIIERQPQISRALMKNLCQELGIARERILNMAQKTVRERVAQTLLMLLDSFRDNTNSTAIIGDDTYEANVSDGILKHKELRIPVSLPREDIANIAGTSTETAIRFLTEFRDEGIISFKGKEINIHNKSALEKICGIA